MPDLARTEAADLPTDTVVITRRRRPATRLLGLGLVVYGLLGIAIFAVVAVAINRPLERARSLSEAVEEQRAALIDALDQAELTIDQMSSGVGGMDTSLSQARAATDRASLIATGVSASMFSLRDSMMITIPLIGGQPLIGLAPGFDNSGQQLALLSEDLTAIGTALETNREDVTATATDLQELAEAVGALSTAVSEGPTVDISLETLDTMRLAIYAVAGWLVLLAVGCVAAGLYLLMGGRRRAV
jgi:hypothetical protein